MSPIRNSKAANNMHDETTPTMMRSRAVANVLTGKASPSRQFHQRANPSSANNSPVRKDSGRLMVKPVVDMPTRRLGPIESAVKSVERNTTTRGADDTIGSSHKQNKFQGDPQFGQAESITMTPMALRSIVRDAVATALETAHKQWFGIGQLNLSSPLSSSGLKSHTENLTYCSI